MNKKVDTIFGVNLKINFTITIATIFYAIVLCVLFVFIPQYRSEFTFLAAVTGGVAAIYSAFYVGRQLQINQEMKLKENSFKFLETLYSIDIVKMRSRLEKEFQHQNITPAQFYDKVVSDPETHTAVRCVLNMFETISIAIQSGYVDENILHDMLHVIVPIHWNIYNPYIQTARERANAPAIFCELQKLNNAWTDGRFLNSNDIIISE